MSLTLSSYTPPPFTCSWFGAHNFAYKQVPNLTLNFSITEKREKQRKFAKLPTEVAAMWRVVRREREEVVDRLV